MKRRMFIKKAAATAVGTVAFPTIVPSSVFGKNAPSNKINIGQIGFGRIARVHDVAETIKYEQAQFIAVCDIDKKRLLDGKKHIDNYYSKKTGNNKYSNVKMYDDYKEMLLNKEIDAVIISTPDHQHAEPAALAALSKRYLFAKTNFSYSHRRQIYE